MVDTTSLVSIGFLYLPPPWKVFGMPEDFLLVVVSVFLPCLHQIDYGLILLFTALLLHVPLFLSSVPPFLSLCLFIFYWNKNQKDPPQSRIS